MTDTGQEYEGKRQVLVELSDKDLLNYLVERTTDRVNVAAKEREDHRFRLLGIALSVAGVLGFGSVTRIINGTVEDHFAEFSARVDTIRRDVEAGAAMTSLNTGARTMESLAEDAVAVGALASGIANSERTLSSSLVPWALLPLVEALGPTERWPVINQVDDELGSALVKNEWTCSAMARSYGVFVLGTGAGAEGEARLNRYLECLSLHARHGEEGFWQLLIDFKTSKNNRSDASDEGKAELEGLPSDQYGQFVDLFCGLADPGNAQLMGKCRRMSGDYYFNGGGFAGVEPYPDLPVDFGGVDPLSGTGGDPDRSPSIWDGPAAKLLHASLAALDSVYPDLLSDPIAREVRAFALTTGRVAINDTVSGTLGGTSDELDGQLTDRWLFTAEADQRLVVEVYADWDTFIYVRSPDDRVGENDDHFGLDSGCAIDPAVAGDYSVLVQPLFDGGDGEYGLVVRDFQPDDEDAGFESCLRRS